MKKIVEKCECYGCSSCINICPNAAISMHEDEQGFLYPIIDENKCCECGLCERVCPANDKSSAVPSIPKIYAVKHKDSAVLNNSSSGGGFTAISDKVLSVGGIIVGAAFDEKWGVYHTIAHTENERNKMRLSKYVQSNMGNVFQDAISDKNANKYILFTGTPCQVEGFRRYIKEKKIDESRIIFCALVCYGTPSPKIWNDYISHIQKEFDCHIESINFRDKRKGWTNSEPLAYTDKSTISLSPYMRLYSSSLCLRPCCYDCKYTTVYRHADISLGDYWGISDSAIDFFSDKGVSLVLTHTAKGEDFFKSCTSNIDLREMSIKSALQTKLVSPTAKGDEYEAFWRDYVRYDIGYILKKYAGITLADKIRRKLRKLFH